MRVSRRADAFEAHSGRTPRRSHCGVRTLVPDDSVIPSPYGHAIGVPSARDGGVHTPLCPNAVSRAESLNGSHTAEVFRQSLGQSQSSAQYPTSPMDPFGDTKMQPEVCVVPTGSEQSAVEPKMQRWEQSDSPPRSTQSAEQTVPASFWPQVNPRVSSAGGSQSTHAPVVLSHRLGPQSALVVQSGRQNPVARPVSGAQATSATPWHLAVLFDPISQVSKQRATRRVTVPASGLTPAGEETSTHTAPANWEQAIADSVQSAVQTPCGPPPPNRSLLVVDKQKAPLGQSVSPVQGPPSSARGPESGAMHERQLSTLSAVHPALTIAKTTSATAGATMPRRSSPLPMNKFFHLMIGVCRQAAVNRALGPRARLHSVVRNGCKNLPQGDLLQAVNPPPIRSVESHEG